MTLGRAALIYIVLMFTTVLSWFVVGRFVVQILVILGGATSYTEVQNQAQLAITATNFSFVAFLIIWTVWLAYVAHANEQETSYTTYRPR